MTRTALAMRPLCVLVLIFRQCLCANIVQITNTTVRDSGLEPDFTIIDYFDYAPSEQSDWKSIDESTGQVLYLVTSNFNVISMSDNLTVLNQDVLDSDFLLNIDYTENTTSINTFIMT